MIIRVFIFSVFTIILLSAEVEQFTLKDGRKLIGTYDSNAHTLTCLHGGIPVSIRVADDQIVARKPSEVPVIPERISVAPKSVESSTPKVGHVQPSPLTKEQVEANAREREAEAQDARDKQAVTFTERFGKPYILPIPENAVRTRVDELPDNLQGSWYRMQYSKEKGDRLYDFSEYLTTNAGWTLYEDQDFVIRSVTKVTSKDGQILGHEIDVKGTKPYFARYVAGHAVALTIGKETTVYSIRQRVPTP